MEALKIRSTHVGTRFVCPKYLKISKDPRFVRDSEKNYRPDVSLGEEK